MQQHTGILRCPHTGESLTLIRDISQLKDALGQDIPGVTAMEACLVNDSRSWLYPVMNGVIFLLPHYAIALTPEAAESKGKMPYDRERVFD